ncbi:MAG: hypothetical protein ACI4Q3_08535 [Kiritimatiellia bacterium]
MDESVSDNPGISGQPNALSLFGSDGAGNDFPVLKAFQQYIDAEQAKARKRMLGLSAFFVLLLVVVVVTFTLITVAVINRNQALSDRLLDIALRDKTAPQQPQPAVAPVVRETTVMQPILDKLESLATALITAKQQQPAPVVVTTTPATPSQSVPPAESAETRQLRDELRQQQEALRAEIDKMKRERAQMEADERKKAEIERHRRRLYPDYYAREDARKAERPVGERGLEAPSPTPAPPERKAAPLPAARPPRPADPAARTPKKTDAIDYFNAAEDDDAELKELLDKSRPAAKPAANGPSSGQAARKSAAPARTGGAKTETRDAAAPGTQTVNIGKTEDDSIPWIVNVPGAANK